MENVSFEFEKNFKKVIERLKSVPNVLAVFVFGSSVKENAKSISYVDIAVILEDPDPEVEAKIESLFRRNRSRSLSPNASSNTVRGSKTRNVHILPG